MCGIAGYIGERAAVPVVVDQLRRLEYRGYDSAGVAAVTGQIDIVKTEGKLRSLEQLVNGTLTEARVAVAHTRWATHGRPSTPNAHPHPYCDGKIVVCHNGIIENYLELRAALQSRGRRFSSETDTEVISHLIDEFVQSGLDFVDASRQAIAQLRGSFSIVVMHEECPDRLVAAKSATPIVIGLGDNENFVASDIPAILDQTRRMIFLESGQMATVRADSTVTQTISEIPIEPQVHQIAWDVYSAAKGEYRHFMQKEIFEQARSLTDTIRGRVDFEREEVVLPELNLTAEKAQALQRIFGAAARDR